MLPNFIHAGVPKAASKTLQLIFKEHPDIYVPMIKEQNFFLSDNLYDKGIDWYENTFYKDTGDASVVGDLSIGYSSGFAKLTPKRIFEKLGADVKFIFVFRHPVDRAYSNYCMARYKGQIEKMEFCDATDRALKMHGSYNLDDIRRVQSGTYYKNDMDMDIYRDCVYLETGLYANVIKRFAEYFNMENMLFVLLDDIIENSQEEANRIFDFLDVNRIIIDFSKRENESTKLKYPIIKNTINKIYKNNLVRNMLNNVLDIRTRGKLKKTLFSKNYVVHKYPIIDLITAQKLQIFYKNDIKELEKLIGKDLSLWGQRY